MSRDKSDLVILSGRDAVNFTVIAKKKINLFFLLFKITKFELKKLANKNQVSFHKNCKFYHNSSLQQAIFIAPQQQMYTYFIYKPNLRKEDSGDEKKILETSNETPSACITVA